MDLVDSSLAMSVSSASASWPCAASASATALAAAASMSAATTRAPALANSCGIDLADALAAAGDDDGASGQIEAFVHGHGGASSMETERYTVRGTGAKPGLSMGRLRPTYAIDL